MRTSIVILNWNGVNFLSEFLPILINKTKLPDVEIVVADNASTDGSLELIKKNYPSITTIILDKNYGFAGGYNEALKQISSEYYVLLNSDVEVSDNWLTPLIAFMDANKTVAACQPKIRSYAQRNYFEHAGAAGGFIDKYGFPFCRGRVFGNVEEDNGQYNNNSDIFWATGACLMIRAELYWKVGGFDDEFFAHMEEIDLCWRLNSRGYRIVNVSESLVYHVGGGTLNVENPHKTYLNFRNNLLLLYKNLPRTNQKKIFAMRFLFDYAAAFQFFITGKFDNALSVLKARIDFRRMMPHFKTKRNENLLFATVINQAQILDKSIVLLYYFKNIKKFSDIL